uniref:Antifreeze protein n=1 Tax=Ditylenchus dipsaci TaxID=166011 RepID=A0A915E7X3_9BILA
MTRGFSSLSLLLVGVLAVYTSAQAPPPPPTTTTTPPPPGASPPVTTLPIVQALMAVLPPAVKALLPSVTIDDAKKVITAMPTLDISSLDALIASLTKVSPPVGAVAKAAAPASPPPAAAPAAAPTA